MSVFQSTTSTNLAHVLPVARYDGAAFSANLGHVRLVLRGALAALAPNFSHVLAVFGNGVAADLSSGSSLIRGEFVCNARSVSRFTTSTCKFVTARWW